MHISNMNKVRELNERLEFIRKQREHVAKGNVRVSASVGYSQTYPVQMSEAVHKAIETLTLTAIDDEVKTIIKTLAELGVTVE